MSKPDAEQIKGFVLKYISNRAQNGSPGRDQVNDDTFDFLKAGIIDSMGILEMIAAMEEQFGITIDFEQMDPETFTLLGPFSRYVANNGAAIGN